MFSESDYKFEIEKKDRLILIIMLAIPMLLLVLGTFQGLLQVLYRAGYIRAMSFLGIELLSGSDPARRDQRHCVYHVFRGRLRLCDHRVLFAQADPDLLVDSFVCRDADRHADGRIFRCWRAPHRSCTHFIRR